jgi:hypothetical protein
VEIGDYNGTPMEGDFDAVTGLIHSSLAVGAENVRVDALGFNADGQVVGCGTGTLEYLMAGGQAGIQLKVTTLDTNARWELYPSLRGLGSLEEPSANRSALQLVAQGFSQTEQGSAGVLVVKNPHATLTVQGAEFTIIAYDETGAVLETQHGAFDTIFPGETSAGYRDLFIPQGKKLARIDVQIRQGELQPDELPENPLSAGQAEFVYDATFPEVNGVVTNQLDRSIDSFDVFAVAYDAAGAVIGGGSQYVQSIPAGGELPVTLWVKVTATPARIDLFAALSAISTIGE